jgi:large subunit ribosomal protein L21
MQAVIKTGGKQYLVAKDQVVRVELLEPEKKKHEFQALMIIDGDKVMVGAPVVKDIKVVAEAVGEVKADKLKILKFKPKKRVKRQTGHRQRHTEIKITSIG